MVVYLVRHGIAEERGAGGAGTDAARALTREGVTKAEAAARGLERLGCRPDCIASSPLVRAEQTARILARVLAPEGAVEIRDFLTPEADPRRLVKWLARSAARSVAAVGHLPHLAEAAALLLSERGDLRLVLKKCAVCCISFPGEPAAGAGVLEWLLQPDQLRAAAGV